VEEKAPMNEQLERQLPFDTFVRKDETCGGCAQFERQEGQLGRCSFLQLLVKTTEIPCEYFNPD
jgi:hypothetical protein